VAVAIVVVVLDFWNCGSIMQTVAVAMVLVVLDFWLFGCWVVECANGGSCSSSSSTRFLDLWQYLELRTSFWLLGG
jgi:hypothetical protein